MAAAANAKKEWYYIDKEEVEQGPFSFSEMQAWWNDQEPPPPPPPVIVEPEPEFKDYAVYGQFNKQTGKFETKTWDKPQDRSLRQMSHYFDVDRYQRIRNGLEEKPQEYFVQEEQARIAARIAAKGKKNFFREYKEQKKKKKRKQELSPLTWD